MEKQRNGMGCSVCVLGAEGSTQTGHKGSIIPRDRKYETTLPQLQTILVLTESKAPLWLLAARDPRLPDRMDMRQG